MAPLPTTPTTPSSSIDSLELQLVQDQSKLNNLAPLLQHARNGHVAALHSCRRVFTLLIQSGRFTRTGTEDESAVAAWLKKQLDVFTDILSDVMAAGDASAAVIALRTLMHLAGLEHLIDPELYGRHFMAAVVSPLLLMNRDIQTLLEVLCTEYVQKYADVKYTMYASLRVFARTIDQEMPEFYLKNMLSLLTLVPGGPEPEEFLTTPVNAKIAKIGIRRKAFDEAWLEFLRLEQLDSQMHLAILQAFPTKVLPWFRRPLLLSDYLTDAFEAADEAPLLALSSLFVLIRDHHLDYPGYFQRLYSLTTSSMLQSNKRARFCELLDASLKSSLIPLHLVAAFCKRLCRLALRGPPSAALFVLPVVYNLLLRNPNLVGLIHAGEEVTTKAGRTASSLDRVRDMSRLLAMGTKISEKTDAFDVYVEDEVDPQASRAMESQLWEIEALKRHYLPSVATLAKSLFAGDLNKDRLRKPELSVQDVVTLNYSSLRG